MDPCPAYVLSPRWDYLAWNDAHRRLFPDIDALPVRERNLVWTVFANPYARSIIVDWEPEARRVLSQYRADTVAYSDDPTVRDMVVRLQEASPEFAAWWPRHDVAGFASRIRRFAHPIAGPLTFEHLQLVPAGADHLRVIVHLGIPGDDSVARLAAVAFPGGPRSVGRVEDGGVLVAQSGLRCRGQPSRGGQLPHGRHRVGVGEQIGVREVDRGGGGVDHPPRRLQRDAVGVGEVDRVHHVVVDDLGDLAVVRQQALAQLEERVLVGQVERHVVELDGPRVGDPGRLGEGVELDAPVLEERHRVGRAELEEVVPECRRADRGHEPGPEDAVVEARGRVHVGGDEGQVVDATPARRVQVSGHRPMVGGDHLPGDGRRGARSGVVDVPSQPPQTISSSRRRCMDSGRIPPRSSSTSRSPWRRRASARNAAIVAGCAPV